MIVFACMYRITKTSLSIVFLLIIARYFLDIVLLLRGCLAIFASDLYPIDRAMHIHHLAMLTGITLSPEREEKIGRQLDTIVDMLEKVKAIQIEKPSHSWHELLQMQATISDTETSSSLPIVDPESLLANVRHPLIGHAIAIKGFVE